MDLVVSTDSGVLHLAGALGKKAFAILKSDPEWRWKKEESDSSGWYDSVSTYLNKDPRDYDWQDTIARIAKDVEKLVKQKK